MQDAPGRAQVGPNQHLGQHAIRGYFGQPHTHQTRKHGVDEMLEGCDVWHFLLCAGWIRNAER
jgi:hypothetical protein